MSTGFMEKATSPSYLKIITIHTSGRPGESVVLLSSSVHLQEAPKKRANPYRCPFQLFPDGAQTSVLLGSSMSLRCLCKWGVTPAQPNEYSSVANDDNTGEKTCEKHQQTIMSELCSGCQGVGSLPRGAEAHALGCELSLVVIAITC